MYESSVQCALFKQKRQESHRSAMCLGIGRPVLLMKVLIVIVGGLDPYTLTPYDTITTILLHKLNNLSLIQEGVDLKVFYCKCSGHNY